MKRNLLNEIGARLYTVDLFGSGLETYNLVAEDGLNTGSEILYWPEFLAPPEAQALYRQSQEQIHWQSGEVVIAGKVYAIPRLQSWIANPGLSYTYSGKTLHPDPWPDPIKTIKQNIEELSGFRFNSLLANLYRDGNDGSGWHADNEKELGKAPVVASLSLGSERRFCLKPKNKLDKARFEITPKAGSLLIMSGSLQEHWLHSVPKTAKPVGERISLTFRKVLAADSP